MLEEIQRLIDAEHLRQGVTNVRAVLGPSVEVGDKDIEDSLWHYYFDEDKTVNYLLRMLVRLILGLS